ncbi:deoxyribose-phosphate aldolase [Enterococcus dispar]|jgi:deoxyribose-phosphate aldolase|uniref:Deoxyribose-phosphate aldolase n=1 Tax=Enterococcus dispar ATCC 51266 TaxID=1139219 RepID=S0KIY0_9ENTE|nr:deoxyribose-phosphate aldolase [Enterococcus dispar]EOT40885.1 deoxyribose-phosphate aldolase [Enterococcus dispar ATCC 51266]EOW86742.1 deoxyribose-phosphate aldolase [Enterococcus dispar ATCC 51266]MCU7357656.1 deoxyribose-phosphate aldolase [Enterococcus dispar]MDT2706337.1 deoxyribose-phosphate aldolase [Enterococcus dispar]OJG39684.1 deoxyribose-phosphate aldolase [Enterococcus dispar]
MKVSEIISLRLVNPAMTDWDFKDQILELQAKPLNEIVVLPNQVARAKQLLARTSIKIGTVIDYPLGNGTIAKKAFEVGKAFQSGADFLEITISPTMLIHQKEQAKALQQTLHSLAMAWGEIRIRVDSRNLKELQKIEIAACIKELGWHHLVLGEGDSFDNAKHDATIFAYDAGKSVKLQINLSQATHEQLQELILSGADSFGVFTLVNLDLSAELREF